MSTNFQVFVVRPYHQEIRERIFGALHALGGAVPEGWATDRNATDPEVIEELAYVLKRSVPDVLLVPFKAVRDSEGHRVNGVDTLKTLYKNFPSLAGKPVLMPVSMHAALAANNALRKWSDSEELSHICTVSQEVIDGPANELARIFREHLQQHGVAIHG